MEGHLGPVGTPQRCCRRVDRSAYQKVPSRTGSGDYVGVGRIWRDGGDGCFSRRHDTRSFSCPGYPRVHSVPIGLSPRQLDHRAEERESADLSGNEYAGTGEAKR